MNSNFRKTFYSSLLAVLLIVSNLIGIKYTNFSSMILSVNFLVFPFVYLCILIINNISSQRDANMSLISAIFSQIFILFIYLLTTKLGSQNVIPDLANYVNMVFKVNIIYIIINLMAIIISSYVLQYIYEYFRIVGYKLLGTVISLLSAIILYGLITIPVINYQFGMGIILKIMVSHVIMAVFMTFLNTLLFYLLKDREYPYEENKIFIKEIKVEVKKNKKDKPIEEVIKLGEKKNVKNRKKKISNNSKKNNENLKKHVKK